MIQPNFKSTKQFGKDLPRELNEFERQVSKAFDRVTEQAFPKLVPTNTKTDNYSAKLDELVVCSGAIAITLPVANAKNAGRAVGVEAGSGTVTVLSINTLVQGAISDAVPSPGTYLYFSDGLSWYRHGGVLSVTAADGTIVIGGTPANPTVAVGVISSANVDDSILTSASLDFARLRQELQRTQLLLMELIELT